MKVQDELFFENADKEPLDESYFKNAAFLECQREIEENNFLNEEFGRNTYVDNSNSSDDELYIMGENAIGRTMELVTITRQILAEDSDSEPLTVGSDSEREALFAAKAATVKFLDEDQFSDESF
jgi:hypothetical protein